ncbi:MAG: hypothetical protein ACK4VI_03135 [Alphaproteobacteria bacterium]
MKKLIATLCIIGSAATLAACAADGHGQRETQVPYAQERTAGNKQVVESAPAEQVFRARQAK